MCACRNWELRERKGRRGGGGGGGCALARIYKREASLRFSLKRRNMQFRFLRRPRRRCDIFSVAAALHIHYDSAHSLLLLRSLLLLLLRLRLLSHAVVVIILSGRLSRFEYPPHSPGCPPCSLYPLCSR